MDPVNVEDALEQLLIRKPSAACLANGVSHLSVVGADNLLFESLDYEIIENDLFKQDWRARQRSEVLQYVIMKWTLAFMIGIIMGCIALVINISVENISGEKFFITEVYMDTGRPFKALAIFTTINVMLTFLGAIICVYVGPAAAGSGVPEVKAYLNGIDAPQILSLNTLVAKIIGTICAVSAGLFVGKEGPMLHIGSCVAYFLGQGGSQRYHMNWRLLRLFKNDRDRRDLVTCGCAAGVAAAFRAPVGGVLFALEEITSWWRSSLLWRTFFATAVVAVVLRLGRKICGESFCGFFGAGGIIMFDTSQGYSAFGLPDLFPVVFLGVTGGILGSLFNKLNTRVTQVYAQWLLEKHPMVKVAQACLMALLTSVCCFGLPWLAPCRPCPDLSDLPYECPASRNSGNFRNFNCPAGEYNDLAGLLFATKDDAVRNLFSTNTYREYHYSSVFVFLVASYIFSLITYGISVPAGLFIPVILNGAAYGRIIGMIMTDSYNGNKLDEGLYAVIGAASFLGGSMRTTVSLCVIVLELTNNLLLLPMIMLVLLISKTVGDIFNNAIWDLYVKIKGFPILEANPEPFMHQLTARDAASCDLVTLQSIELVSNVVRSLRKTRHNAFPLVDVSVATGNKILGGLVLRAHLLVLLKNKAFQSSAHSNEESLRKKFAVFDFAKPATGKGLRIEEIELTDEEEDCYMDLRPITNASPYTVLETISLAKAYTLFRKLGLRHLCVVPKKPEGIAIVGILTRHDFLQERLLKLYPYLTSKSPRFSGIPWMSSLF